MKKPEIIGWEITTNENNVEMATLPVNKLMEILEYINQPDVITICNCNTGGDFVFNEVEQELICNCGKRIKITNQLI